MGCCCFNTLRGAAFFVASIHIYNGLECMLKFIAFPLLFSSMHASKDPAEATSFISFMPGMVYSILYFLLGCCIFRGIEQECSRNVKWGGICFSITEICFFILRQVFKVTPTPKVAHLPSEEQPFEMNIYKTLYYFVFTIVGGIIYVCILFLYLQQLSKGQDEFAQFFNISARAPWSTPTPTTTTQAPQPPTEPQQQQQQQQSSSSQQTNNNSSLQSNLNPNNAPGSSGNPPSNAQSRQGQQQQQQQRSSKHHKSSHHQHGGHKGEEQQQPHNNTSHNTNTNPRKPRAQHASNININPVDSGQVLSPPPSQGGGVGGPIMDPTMIKDPCGPGSPSSPMFPYFLMRRSSKHSGGGGGGGSAQGQAPQPPPHIVNHQRCLMDEPPPPPTMWHQHQHNPNHRGPPPMPPLRQDFSSLEPGGTPRSGGSDSIGVGRNLLSPSRLVVNHGHGGLGPLPPLQGPPPPSHFQPIIPPFYPDSGEEQRRDSFPGAGFQSPHYGQSQSGYSSRAGGGPESLYQKIPMSPGFDYCLR